MKLSDLLTRACCSSTRFLKRNSSTILTCIGSAGVIVTAVVAVKATPTALTLLKEAKEEKGEDLTPLETIVTAGPAYIPSAVIGVSTIACIFGANVLNKRHQASIMSAYALANTAYKDYRNKVKEMLGDDTDRNIRAAIALDKRNDIDCWVPGYTSMPTKGEKILFYEEYRQGYFEASVEAVQSAEYHFNRNFAMRGYANINEFYDFLGLDHTDEGDILAWSCDRLMDEYEAVWIDFDHELVTMEDGLECYIIHMPIPPVAYDGC